MIPSPLSYFDWVEQQLDNPSNVSVPFGDEDSDYESRLRDMEGSSSEEEEETEDDSSPPTTTSDEDEIDWVAVMEQEQDDLQRDIREGNVLGVELYFDLFWHSDQFSLNTLTYYYKDAVNANQIEVLKVIDNVLRTELRLVDWFDRELDELCDRCIAVCAKGGLAYHDVLVYVIGDNSDWDNNPGMRDFMSGFLMTAYAIAQENGHADLCERIVMTALPGRRCVYGYSPDNLIKRELGNYTHRLHH
jgi:hypothetical protein